MDASFEREQECAENYRPLDLLELQKRQQVRADPKHLPRPLSGNNCKHLKCTSCHEVEFMNTAPARLPALTATGIE